MEGISNFSCCFGCRWCGLANPPFPSIFNWFAKVCVWFGGLCPLFIHFHSSPNFHKWTSPIAERSRHRRCSIGRAKFLGMGERICRLNWAEEGYWGKGHCVQPMTEALAKNIFKRAKAEMGDANNTSPPSPHSISSILLWRPHTQKDPTNMGRAKYCFGQCFPTRQTKLLF
jgi:hypothetical protein